MNQPTLSPAAAAIVDRVLDAGFAPHRDDIIPERVLTPERREVVGVRTVAGRWGGDGTYRWDGSHERAILGDVVDAGGEVLNHAAVVQAEAALTEALTDPRIWQDRKGYIRPTGCVGAYDLDAAR